VLAKETAHILSRGPIRQTTQLQGRKSVDVLVESAAASVDIWACPVLQYQRNTSCSPDLTSSSRPCCGHCGRGMLRLRA
jgi:hypothetical protein